MCFQCSCWYSEYLNHALLRAWVIYSWILTLQLRRRWEVNGKLCIKEVGVDLELCVHAHGHDVELIMEASCINNNPLVISPSCIYNWSFATVVPTMIVLLDSILGQVKVLVFFRSFHLSNLYFDLPLGITLSYLEIITEPHNFFWVLHQVLHSHELLFFLGFEWLVTRVLQ